MDGEGAVRSKTSRVVIAPHKHVWQLDEDLTNDVIEYHVCPKCGALKETKR